MKGDPEISERENLAYGARPYLETTPPPAPRDLMKQVVLNPPSEEVAADPATLEDLL
jgi:hypothetical protein